MSEQEELLKLIDEELHKSVSNVDKYEGILNIRCLVYDFFNAPKEEQTPNDQQDFGL
jgi:hypothetical protein